MNVTATESGWPMPPSPVLSLSLLLSLLCCVPAESALSARSSALMTPYWSRSCASALLRDTGDSAPLTADGDEQ